MPKNCLRTCVLALLLFGAAAGVPAHEGHHEAEPEAPVPAEGPAPGAAHAMSDTPQVELVAQREGADIVLYLDDYASNAPLNGLQVSVRSGALNLQAAAAGEGSYRIPGDLIDAQPARTLEITVHGAGIDAQLQAPVPSAVPAAAAAPAASAAAHPLWLLAIALAVLLAAAGGYLLWRKRGRRGMRGLGPA
jgi:hypothetical protein